MHTIYKKMLQHSCIVMILIVLWCSAACSAAYAAAIDRVVLTPSGSSGNCNVIVTLRAAGNVKALTVEYRYEGNIVALQAQPSYNEKYDYTIFKAELQGLMPDTDYEYRFTEGDFQSQWQTLHTIGPEKPVTFIYMGDSQEDMDEGRGYESWGKMLNKAVSDSKADLVMLGGDLINDGSDESEWDRFFAGAGDAFQQVQLAPAVGNHDNTKLFRSIFSVDSFYSFDMGNVHFAVLDSNKMGGADQQDMEWLRKDLAASQNQWKIVMFHHPVYKAVNMTRDDWRSEIYAEKWVPIMEESKVDVVLNGHQHVYMRTQPMLDGEAAEDGITYIMGVSNNKSYEVADYDYTAASYDGGPVYTVFATDGGSLTAVTYEQHGQVVDSFSLNKQNNRENKGVDLSELMLMWYDLIKNLIIFRAI